MEDEKTYDVLIVEDDPESYVAMEGVILWEVPGIFGKEISMALAKNYEAAEREIRQRNFDLILLDHRMPRREGGEAEKIGYGLIPMIRELSPQSTVIGTSGSGDEELKGFQRRDFDCMSKRYFLRDTLEEVANSLTGLS